MADETYLILHKMSHSFSLHIYRQSFFIRPDHPTLYPNRGALHIFYAPGTLVFVWFVLLQGRWTSDRFLDVSKFPFSFLILGVVRLSMASRGGGYGRNRNGGRNYIQLIWDPSVFTSSDQTIDYFSRLSFILLCRLVPAKDQRYFSHLRNCIEVYKLHSRYLPFLIHLHHDPNAHLQHTLQHTLHNHTNP